MANATYNNIPVPQCWQDFEDVLDAGIKRVLLIGAPGIGKTYSAMHHGDIAGGSFRLICTEDMTTFNVGGGHMPNERGGFEFKPGAALRAWLGNGVVGGRLVVDEIDKAGSDVFAELLAFLDSPESASYMHPDTGEVYRPREGFSAIMTSNIEDPNELPQALKDRFPVCISINAAHPAALLKLPENLQQLAAAIVAGQNLGDGQGTVRASLRAFDAFETLRKSPNFTPMRAANMVFGKALASAIVGSLQVGTLTPEITL
jgi:hypothetical protein